MAHSDVDYTVFQYRNTKEVKFIWLIDKERSNFGLRNAKRSASQTLRAGMAELVDARDLKDLKKYNKNNDLPRSVSRLWHTFSIAHLSH